MPPLLSLRSLCFSDIISATQSYWTGEQMQSNFTVSLKTTLRRISAWVMLFILLSLPVTSAYSSGSSYIPCDCLTSPCSCFIQEGDKGDFVKAIVKLLKDKRYLKKSAEKTVFTAETTAAVKRFQRDNGLEPTGMMDDDTLTLLIWGMLPEELDLTKPYVYGNASTIPATVYVPVVGGKKRHATAQCCNMDHPRKVSIRNAEAVGFDACKIDGCERDMEVLLYGVKK